MAKQKPDPRNREPANSRASRKNAGWQESTGHPHLDLFARGPLLEILDRFRLRLIEEAGKIANHRKINALDLERAYLRLLSSDNSDDWSVLNRRRVFLIQKQVAGDISRDESAELEELQANADRHMSEVAPRPLEELWDLKRKLTGK